MKIHKIALIAVAAFYLCLPGCSSQKAETKKDSDNKAVNLIAVLPVESSATDTKASKMLRVKLNDELRFKGYPQITPEMVDNKLAPLTGDKELRKNDVIPPKVLEELLGADAAMYCSLKSREATGVFYTPVTVSVQCKLRSTRTGETLWNARYESTNRSFDLFSERLKLKSRGSLEAALEEVVGKVMETLPYGPKLRG